MEKTLGGDRIGSGKKMKVELHGYERSTHNLSYVWRSTMSAGTLVPFMRMLGLPGDTFDIDLECDVKTHPTIGPLFGSYKVQLDTYVAPIRLYIAALHNNELNIGRDMSQVKFPLIEMTALPYNENADDQDNQQINPSSLLAYLGLRGIGKTGVAKQRTFNALYILAYWDTYKNYYANKQEEIGAVLHTPSEAVTTDPTDVELNGNTLPESPATGVIEFNPGNTIKITLSIASLVSPINEVYLSTDQGDVLLNELTTVLTPSVGNTVWEGIYDIPTRSQLWVYNWRLKTNTDVQTGKPSVATFPLTNIDEMRKEILITPSASPFLINDTNLEPYRWLYEQPNTIPNVLSSQEGLALKTYQSDLFNNWIQTEWIDGAGGITEITSVDTSGGSFSIDQLTLSRKMYDMLNRIAVAGGSYDDWQDAVWAHQRYKVCTTPMYQGGLIKELVFQEVVSNAAAAGEGVQQPLGTLAGKGIMSNKHKGGKVVIKIDEPCVILGIISLTPRVDYSQGNDWSVNLQTMNDIFKPPLDQIGFQDLITEQLHWAETENLSDNWVTKSAGKQPAWINYMTDINRTYGNFAIQNNEMFMTLNRRYEMSVTGITDLTTYIDPSKFNFIFAETALDAQNFWAQIGINITARRKMSGKVMPNL